MEFLSATVYLRDAGENAIRFFLENGQVAGAVCAEGTTGFLCAECAEDYVKVSGQCVACTGFDVPVFLMSLAMAFCTALFLLHSSTGASALSNDDIRHIWYKFDIENRGYLYPDQVFNVLRMTGKHMTDKVFAEYMLKQFGVKLELETAEGGGGDVEEGTSFGLLRMDSRRRKNKVHYLQSDAVAMKDFLAVYAAQRPSKNIGLLIFFFQTLGLIAKDTSQIFDAASALDLNAEKTTESCM